MFGRTLLNTNSVIGTRVSADNAPIQKPGGVTIDWTTVSAVGSDTNLPDGGVIRNGTKFLRYGQVICRITGGSNTVNTSGTPTGGTFTLTVTTNQGTQTTAAIAYNAAASAVASAIGALSNVGTANVSASGGPLTTGNVTLTFASILGTVSLALVNNSLTGGTSPSVVIGNSLSGATATDGYFGPYDPAASDGRQNLNRGDSFVLDQTYLQYGVAGSGVAASNDQIGNAIEGGLIWIDRVLQAGTGTHSLAAGPTLAEFTAAFPSFRFAKN